ncbi:helicase-related protein [Sphingomonas profundi]|uniref:helicase-related protein n=1 Tax=Alterirhizorhabdus profundi TaxID=2681549 RepID=UPI0012E92F3A|nr:helicase-related protein [Sphingomonas profundi]
MLADIDGPATETTSPVEDDKVVPAASGMVAARLALALADGDLIYVAESGQRAEAVAAALEAMAPQAAVVLLPQADGLPGEDVPATPANIGRRVAAFRRLAARDGGRVALISTAEAAAMLHPAPESFAGAPLAIAAGDPIDPTGLRERLEAIGYFLDDRVDEHGEMAIRGTVVDLFPADALAPLRIETADGAIAAIRAYDAVTQRGGEAIERIEVGAACEPAVGDTTLFDHVPGAAIAIDPGATERRDRFIALAEDGARTRRAHKRPPLKTALADAARWEQALAGRERIDVAAGDEEAGERFVEARQPVRAVAKAIRAAREQGDRVVLAAGPRDLRFLSRRIGKPLGEAPQLVEDWQAVEAAPPGALLAIAAPIERGWRAPGLLAIAAADLLGARAGDEGTVATIDPLSGEATDFRLGDVVIHEDFGIGVLRGIEPVTAGDVTSDAIRIEYAKDGQRLVPVEEADRIWRYGADADAVSLDRLDGSGWQKRRGDIAAAVAESAKGLSALAAERATRKAPVLDPPVADYERFAGRFPFTETRDQLRAIEAVRADLASGRPMDRLVVGDVGYGKTEVALRAAAIAALAGRQVAIVAPTTVLVRQHLETFRRRFEGLDIAIAGLSRLSTPAEAKAAKAGLADGSVRIVIGTSAIAAKGVRFAALGLVVIDEEQRFGAADKLKLRTLSDACHVLTLTATPIPRTLQTALVGLQELSVIATPPAVRQPIRTSVGLYDPALVRMALLREQARGGQSFVVVPRIEDMAKLAEMLRGLVPELAVREAHGKMSAAEIDAAMVGFAEGEGDVLLATNIIEAGLDVPRANTMIVWRADRFGLSQLHQLRGRVGRAARRGQVLLLTDPADAIKPATLKRLRTLEALDRLGAGFAISARDLDMRGAGDLLGDEQAGHMKLIGVDLYQHLLGQALRAARGEAADRWTPGLSLGLAGSLPEAWIPEVELRLNLYVRLARAATPAALDALEEEMEDRFGTLPAEARTLMAIARIRLLAAAAMIDRVVAGPAAIALTPRSGFAGATDGLEAKGDRLLLRTETDANEARLAQVATLLEGMGDG